MRFFTTGAHKSNTPLYTAFGFFLFFLLLFWIGSFIYFGLKYTYTSEGIAEYFFGPVDFPLAVSIAQIAEAAHISLFLSSILLLALAGFLLHVNISFNFKIVIISLLFIAGLADNTIDFLIINLSREWSFLKLFTFFFFQGMIVLSLIVIVKDYFRSNLQNKHKTSSYFNVVILLFSILSFVLALVNIYLFKEKIGFDLISISDYYKGNEQLFINEKSLAGMVEIAVPHLAAFGILLVALTHFLSFTEFKFKTIFILLIYISALSDIFSSFIVRFSDMDMAYLKLLSFIVFEGLLVIGSVILFYYSITNKVFIMKK